MYLTICLVTVVTINIVASLSEPLIRQTLGKWLLILTTILLVSNLIYGHLMFLLCTEVSFCLVEDTSRFLNIHVNIKTKLKKGGRRIKKVKIIISMVMERD